MKPSLVAVCLLLGALGTAFSADKPVWKWQEADTEIYQPVFSPDGTELVFVRKKHIPDFSEAESLSDEELKKKKAPIDKDERYADPEVVIVKIGEKEPLRVDWGWLPAFSPDGQSVAYAFQKKPISRFRVLAETLAGNEIRLFQRADKSIRTLAVPASGHLESPIFTPDGQAVVYDSGTATNGAHAGSVGVAQVSLDGKTTEDLLPPAKEFDLYDLIENKQFIGGKLYVLRYKPTSAGDFMANSYSGELLELGTPPKTVYSWKSEPTPTGVRDFGLAPDGKLLVYDQGWREPGTATDKAAPPATGEDVLGIHSPDGRLIASIGDAGLEIREFPSGKPVETISVKGELQGAAWSPDSKRVAVLVTESGEQFLQDSLQVFDLKAGK